MIISILKLLFLIAFHVVPLYFLKINKYLIAIIIIFLFKKKRLRNDFDDIVKSGLIKKREYSLNKNNFFIIKKNLVNKEKKIILDHENILHYPSLKKNTIAVGDIVLFTINKNPSIIQRFLMYSLNSKITHMGIIKYFIIDFNNDAKFNLPENYYLVTPMLTQTGAILDKTYLKTITFPYYFVRKNLNPNTGLSHFRYKKINDIKENIHRTIEKYNFSHYDISTYFEYATSYFMENWVVLYNILLNTSHFGTFKKFYKFSLKYIISREKKKVSVEKLNNLDLLIAIYYSKLKGEKNKEKIKEITNHIKDLTNYLKNIKNETGFVCSSFVYYVYKINGVDITNKSSYNIKDIDYSIFFTPDNFESLFTDDRFEYISTFKG